MRVEFGITSCLPFGYIVLALPLENNIEPLTRSITSSKCTSTSQKSRSGNAAELWIRADILPCLILLARKPKTNSKESITFDFPDPFGPTTDEKEA